MFERRRARIQGSPVIPPEATDDREFLGQSIVVIEIDDARIEGLTQQIDRVGQRLVVGRAGKRRAPEIDERLLPTRRTLNLALRLYPRGDVAKIYRQSVD